jgi:hypothetical protein
MQRVGVFALAGIMLSAPLSAIAHNPEYCPSPCCEEKSTCCGHEESSCAEHLPCDECLSVFPDNATLSGTTFNDVLRKVAAAGRLLSKYQVLFLDYIARNHGSGNSMKRAGIPVAPPDGYLCLASTVLRL